MGNERQPRPDVEARTEDSVNAKHDDLLQKDLVAQKGSDPKRRPYQRPGIISREVWESVAGVCSPEPPAKSTRPPCSLVAS